MPPAAQQRTTLIVDDDAMMRLLVRTTLENIGMRVIEAADGEAGLALFQREQPDIVLLDVMMPGIDGYTVCERMRALSGVPRTPILMLTGLDDHESITRAYDAGATDFVTKPIPWPILAHRVRYILRSSDALADLALSQASLAHAQRIARLASWVWDIAADRWRWSAEARAICEGSQDRDSDAPSALTQLAHPDDRERVEQAMRIAAQQLDPLSLQFRVLLPDGSERVLDVQGEASGSEGSACAMRGTIQDITERAQAAEKIRHLAYYDGLTGLPNRAMLKEQLGYALAQAARHGRMVATLVLDLDGFKRINDTLGHSIGDQLLKQARQRLREGVRNVDRISRADAQGAFPNVARLGGDEFIVLLTELAHMPDAAKVAQRILDSLAQPFEIENRELFISASIGIALYPSDGEDDDALLRNADTALCHARERGRNSYQFYNMSMNATAFERLALDNHLRKALDRNELTLYYQPKIDASSGRIVGAEALLRWLHPDMGLVPPGAFIPLAEETGLIRPISAWVLEQACLQLRAWHDAGYAPLHMAVNVSGMSFRENLLLGQVERALSQSGISPGLLELELTESVLMSDAEETMQLLRRLKVMGVRLAVDDFGTGYSSLSYLKRFPLDALKIDRSFVQDIATDPEDRAITAAIIALARSLGVSTVAEGVETRVQAELLQSLGCPLMQGYLFARPVPAREFEVLLRNASGAVAPRPQVKAIRAA